ncbi:hypothetical protein [Streptomyces sp. NBC_01205]|uniref:hypothetical protein n=1 Tax=Streptomyces sp. NBC_01205 TaxID=2903771 RepID=UPI002E13C6B0|nr:hypothetical protein OG573_42955 [Streptomyces sp. NBC_01205]
MRRQRTFRDPTPDRTGSNSVGWILDGLDDFEATVFLTTAVLEWPPAQTARLLRCAEEDVRKTHQLVLPQFQFLDYLEKVHSEFDGRRIFSAELRSCAREICEALIRRCPRCEEPFMQRYSARGGRPREFCRNACRQAAYRKRWTAPAAESDTAALPPPGGFQPHHPRPVVCPAYRGRMPELGPGLMLRCLLFRGHEGRHCALTGLADDEYDYLVPTWVRWEGGTSPAVVLGPCGCALPGGHAGRCLWDRRLWSQRASTAPTNDLEIDRETLRAVRARLSSPEKAARERPRIG